MCRDRLLVDRSGSDAKRRQALGRLSIAVQYAAAAGARVLATARPGEEADFVRGLGAHEVVDYTGDLASQVRAVCPDGVDVVLHFAGDGETLVAALTEKGRLASTVGYGPDQHPAAIFIMANPTGETLRRLAADVADGKVTVPVGRTYPLDQVPAAFADFASGTRGKIAITVD